MSPPLSTGHQRRQYRLAARRRWNDHFIVTVTPAYKLDMACQSRARLVDPMGGDEVAIDRDADARCVGNGDGAVLRQFEGRLGDPPGEAALADVELEIK